MIKIYGRINSTEKQMVLTTYLPTGTVNQRQRIELAHGQILAVS